MIPFNAISELNDMEQPENVENIMRVETEGKEALGNIVAYSCCVDFGNIVFAEHLSDRQEHYSDTYSIYIPPRIMALFMPFIQEKLKELGTCRQLK